MIQIN